MTFINYLDLSNLISHTQLEEALKLQHLEEAKLEIVLINYGYTTKLSLYKYLASQLNLEFVDITQSPGDITLIKKEEIEDYIKYSFLPYRMQNNNLIILTSQIPEILCKQYHFSDKNITFKITSPNDIRWAIEYAFSTDLSYEACNLLRNFSKINTPASYHISQNVLMTLLLTLALILSFYKYSFLFIIYFSNIFYFINNGFKLLLTLIGALFPKKNQLENLNESLIGALFPKKNQLENLNESLANFEIYTILIPLYKERSLDYLIDSLNQLDYPKTKLDIKFVLEADDHETIEYVKNKKCPYHYEIIIVPVSFPRTKAKACNYAIKFAKGKYLTIFDAEDIPDKLQLKKAHSRFKNGPKELACLQASLNFYNREENLLTQMFALEYGLWFKWLLKGLERLKLPIPLGGTSCHFKTAILKQVCYWDPYNVTEDAELGLRLFYCGYTTEILDAETMEESPIYVSQWIKQRTRWIKGYIQTYIINFNFTLYLLFIQKNYRYFITVQLFIGLPSILFTIKPFLFICNLALIFFPSIIFLSQNLLVLMTLNFISGIFISIISSLILMIIKNWSRKLSCIVFPFYWILHSFAAFKAIREIFNAPFYWNKTPHGLSKLSPYKKNP